MATLVSVLWKLTLSLIIVKDQRGLGITLASSSLWDVHYDQPLPIPSMNMAVGFYEGTYIYIMYVLPPLFIHLTVISTETYLKHIEHSGGDSQPHQMVVWEFEEGYFRDYGTDFLNLLGNDHGEYGSVSYAQLQNTLYTVSEFADYIHVYDLNPESLSFGTINSEPGIPITVGHAPCLASSETPTPRLYITGGYQNTSTSFEIYRSFWILDLGTNDWSSGRHMNSGRFRHGCIVVDDSLWVMGTVPQIETINITDIPNAEWSVHSNLSLPENLTDFGVVSTHDISQSYCDWFGVNHCNDHSIFIIGGWTGTTETGYDSDVVYIVDTKHANLTTEILPYGVSALSVVSTGSTIHGFGGRNGGIVDSWISYELLSDVWQIMMITLISTIATSQIL